MEDFANKVWEHLSDIAFGFMHRYKFDYIKNVIFKHKSEFVTEEILTSGNKRIKVDAEIVLQLQDKLQFIMDIFDCKSFDTYATGNMDESLKKAFIKTMVVIGKEYNLEYKAE